ncbi:MAG: glycosyltransferase family 2 protein [Candidatus Omnitrophica bacterium]|nr:glycosyltransferase family 2 protein [Candidatus Omnitrophota bacterium]MBI3021891.1 glycosyltransferase family 2 protein [Candidatus Omnitrophota bacterium]
MSDTPVCDLVLLSWNHLEETRPCLETLFASTGVPCRLLIVDNGSEPEVRAFLRTVTPRGHITEVTLLQNEQNEGFPKGMNRGIQASTAPFVCLLNNDLLFTKGWLEELIDVAGTHREIGVVNPSSSTLGNRPSRGESLQEYADSLRPLHGVYTEVGMCIGYCILIKRAVIDRIGGLSEEVERAFFEDEDFSARAQQAGFQCVVAEASYVYHAEHQSVRHLPEREALFAKNRKWCEERWGRRIRLAWPRFEPVVPGSDELRPWLEQMIQWARKRTLVYVYSPMPSGVSAEVLFRSVGLVPHIDVHWHAVPAAFAPWATLGFILQRRKKPFDIIVAPTKRWERRVARLKWLHGADVVPLGDDAQLVKRWQHRSRCLRR